MNLFNMKLPGKSLTNKNVLEDFLIKFTPKNHNNVKHLNMGDGDYLIEVPLPLKNKVNNESLSSVLNRMLDKLLIKHTPSPEFEIEQVEGINFPVMHFEDGVIIVYYPIYLK